jgi:hypothetical protein
VSFYSPRAGRGLKGFGIREKYGNEPLPARQEFEGEPLDYNCTGYETLTHYLKRWGVDVSEFNGRNEGYPISAETCNKVADALDAHLHELSADHKRWLECHAAEWRRLGEAGGCEQH